MGTPVKAFTVACTSVFLLAAHAEAATHTVIVAGLGGEPAYEQRFKEQAEALAQAAAQLSGDPAHVTRLLGSGATRAAIREAFGQLGRRLTADDALLVVLIGHGTYDGEEYRFNLPGPDMTGRELLALFDELPAREQLIVNTTSASGAVAESWKRSGRIVIAATKSGGERSATRFAEHWTRGVTSNAADINKDEIVTATEAFDYATRQVAAAYKSDTALATEHARIEGDDAARFAVARLGTAAIRSTDPQVNALLSQRATIERDLDAVKARKTTVAQNEYYDELESVLVRLAQLQRQIDAQQGTRDAQGAATP